MSDLNSLSVPSFAASNRSALPTLQSSLMFSCDIFAMEFLISAACRNLPAQPRGTVPFTRDSMRFSSADRSAFPSIDLRFWQFPYNVLMQVAAAHFLPKL
ncbi:Glucose-methanol-choline oxidoreductase, C-terminal [Neofusicoccum parvum]|nr:Glucose-methanol-choline oxidoreductase, C-terminal [Neofusicoccum parvum]